MKKIILVTMRFSFLKSSWWVTKWVYLTIDITWQYLYPPIKLQNSSLFSRDRPWSTATEYNNVAVHCESSAELAMYARREKALDLTEIYMKHSNNILRWNVKCSSQFHTSPISLTITCDLAIGNYYQWKLLQINEKVRCVSVVSDVYLNSRTLSWMVLALPALPRVPKSIKVPLRKH